MTWMLCNDSLGQLGIKHGDWFLAQQECSFTSSIHMVCTSNFLLPGPVTKFDIAQWLPAGNMAGESAALRSRLHANGAVKPLLHLLLAAEGHPEPRTLSAACTAAWALSNLLQDQSHAVSCFALSLSPCSSCLACVSLPHFRYAYGQYA